MISIDLLHVSAQGCQPQGVFIKGTEAIHTWIRVYGLYSSDLKDSLTMAPRCRDQ